MVDDNYKDETDILRALDLSTIMRAWGYEPIAANNDDGDITYVISSDVIRVRRDKFWCVGARRGGGGAIDLVMVLEDCGFREARAILRINYLSLTADRRDFEGGEIIRPEGA